MDTRFTLRQSVNGLILEVGRTRQTKTDIVVTFIAPVVVTVRGAQVLWFVVPGPAAPQPTAVVVVHSLNSVSITSNVREPMIARFRLRN